MPTFEVKKESEQAKPEPTEQPSISPRKEGGALKLPPLNLEKRLAFLEQAAKAPNPENGMRTNADTYVRVVDHIWAPNQQGSAIKKEGGFMMQVFYGANRPVDTFVYDNQGRFVSLWRSNRLKPGGELTIDNEKLPSDNKWAELRGDSFIRELRSKLPSSGAAK